MSFVMDTFWDINLHFHYLFCKFKRQKTIHSYAGGQVARKPNDHEEAVDDGEGEEGGVVDAGLAQVLHDVGGHVLITPLHQWILKLHSVTFTI